MNQHNYIVKGILISLILGVVIQIAGAQSVNNWRGDEMAADWNNLYKWKLKHPPTGSEAAYFRTPNSTISVNSTIQLNNGMHLYGQELSLKGNGNINLLGALPHERTVNIPASASGFANMTLNDNLSLNGRVALSAKAFGTSAGKGTITLKDRSNVTGALCVGNAGNGTGKVIIKDNATYRITALELDTRAASGGSAEIHILGGTARIEAKGNPFDTFLADSSRKIVLGTGGTLRVDSNLSALKKKFAIKAMIKKDRLVAAPGSRLILPVFNNEMLVIRAEDERNDSKVPTKTSLLSAIDAISAQPKAFARSAQVQAPVTVAQTSKESLKQKKDASPKVAGYIVFVGIALLALRRPADSDE